MKKNKKVKKQNEGADYFTALVKSDLKLEIVKEHRFHPVRRFRFDYAILQYKIAIEVEGGIWLRGKSGHSSGTGIKRDMEKHSLASSLGWRVIRVQPSDLYSRNTLNLIRDAIKNSI